MIGYGPFHYRYASGREGDAHLLALSPRKNYISLYVLCTTDGAYLAESYKDRLPKANIGKSCVRFKRPSDIDLDQLRALVAEAVRLGPPWRRPTTPRIASTNASTSSSVVSHEHIQRTSPVCSFQT